MNRKTEGDSKPTFRLRFTISNSTTNDSDDRNFRDQSRLVDTGTCLDREHTTNTGSTCTSDRKKLFQFIQPQNHKSSLIVNLSGFGGSNDIKHENHENHLFISPNLNESEPSLSSPTKTTSAISATDLSLDDFDSDYLYETSDNSSVSSTMSQGCNFINSLMSATRHRSASVTPQALAPKTTLTVQQDAGPRASSTDNLANARLKNSDNPHLIAIGSDETICDANATQVHIDSGYIQHADLNMLSPLQIDVDESSDLDNISYSNLYDPDETLPLEVDDLQLLDECKNLESQVQYWEQKVDDLERKRIEKDDVPRTLVESVLNQRKTLRELEFQIYKLNLEESDLRIHNLSPQKNDKQSPLPTNLDSRVMGDYDVQVGSRLTTSRLGSLIRPGQENTADILDAIPPSGALQHRQYLNRASSGTDSSEYSQIPSYNLLQHRLPANNQTLVSSDDSNMSADNNQDVQFQRRDHLYHSHHHRNHLRQASLRNQGQQLYVQLDTVNQGVGCQDTNSNNNCRARSRQRLLPVSPHPFSNEFIQHNNSIINKQDSSSPTSSGSPR